MCYGGARPKRAASPRPSGVQRSRRASARSPPASATRPCANIIGAISATGCGGCSSMSDRGRVNHPGEGATANDQQPIGGESPAAHPHLPTLRHSPPAPTRPRAARGAPGPYEGRYVVASPQLAASPLLRGRAAIPRREALILQAAINHPWLLDEHLEALANIEFRHPDAEKLKAALIDIAA